MKNRRNFTAAFKAKVALVYSQKNIISPKKIMLKFINRKTGLQWVLLLGLLSLSIYTIITKTQVANEAGTAFLYKSFTVFFSQHELFGKGLIILTLLLQIIFLQYCFGKYESTPKKSLLPTCFFLSILLLTKSLTIISPFFFTLLFFLKIISLDYTEVSEKIKSNTFLGGLLIAFATCLDISSIIFLLLVIVTLFINQYSRVKEIGILLLGFAVFYLYVFSYYFLTNNLNEWILTFKEIKILGILDSKTLNSTQGIISLICLGLIYMFFIIKLKLVNDSKVIIQRKKITSLNIRAVLIIACLLISSSTYPQVLGYLFIHLSIYLALLSSEKSQFYINEIVTIITFVVLCL